MTGRPLVRCPRRRTARHEVVAPYDATRLFLVPVLDRWLLSAPLHAVAAVISGAAARDLRRGDTVLPDGPMADLGRTVRIPPSESPAPRRGELSPPMLGIIRRADATSRPRTAASGRSPPDATRCRFRRRSRPSIGSRSGCVTDRRDVRVHFFGGEPFLAPEVVAVAVHRVRLLAGRNGFNPYIDASTNGVFDVGLCEFVGDYFSGIVVSLDGPAEIHDRVRARSAASRRSTTSTGRCPGSARCRSHFTCVPVSRRSRSGSSKGSSAG